MTTLYSIMEYAAEASYDITYQDARDFTTDYEHYSRQCMLELTYIYPSPKHESYEHSEFFACALDEEAFQEFVEEVLTVEEKAQLSPVTDLTRFVQEDGRKVKYWLRIYND